MWWRLPAVLVALYCSVLALARHFGFSYGGYAGTFVFDIGIALFTFVIGEFWQVGRHRLSGSARSALAEPLVTTAGGAAATPDAETKPIVKRYLLVLQTLGFFMAGLWLCTLATNTMLYGGFDIGHQGILRSERRTLFSAPCVEGWFPNATRSDVWSCFHAGDAVEILGGQWFVPPHNRTDPRPAGMYYTDVSEGFCKQRAEICTAQMFAFRGGSGPLADGECWLFDDRPTHLPLIAFPGFSVCKASGVDHRPGRIMFYQTLLYGFLAVALAVVLLWRLKMSRHRTASERTCLWITEIPTTGLNGGILRPTRSELVTINESLKAAFHDLDPDLDLKVVALVRGGEVYAPAEGPSPVESPSTCGSLKSEDPGTLTGSAVAILPSGHHAKRVLDRARARTAHCLDSCFACLGRFCAQSFSDGVTAPLFVGTPPFLTEVRMQHCCPVSDFLFCNLKGDGNTQRACATLRKEVVSIVVFVLAIGFQLPGRVASWISVYVLQHPNELFFHFSSATVQTATEQLPSYFLLFVNSVVVPWLITVSLERQELRKKSLLQLSIYRFMTKFLTLTMIVLPLVGSEVSGSILEYLHYHLHIARDKATTSGAVEVIHNKLSSLSGALLVKYAMHTALITPGLQRLQLAKLFLGALGRCCAFFSATPWDFPFGYWASWALSMFILCMTVGILMPSMLFHGALFFFMLWAAHRSCFQRSIFDVDFTGDLNFEFTVASDLLQGVAFFWTFMGLYFYGQSGKMPGEVTVWWPYPDTEWPRDEWVRIRNWPLNFDMPADWMWFLFGLFTSVSLWWLLKIFFEVLGHEQVAVLFGSCYIVTFWTMVQFPGFHIDKTVVSLGQWWGMTLWSMAALALIVHCLIKISLPWWVKAGSGHGDGLQGEATLEAAALLVREEMEEYLTTSDNNLYTELQAMLEPEAAPLAVAATVAPASGGAAGEPV